MSADHTRRLRALVARRAAVIVPGAPDALTARVIEDTGFEAVYVTGAGVSNAFLGLPDLGLLTLSELADHVSAMRDATALPLIVDADTGFGNAVNVTRTVSLLERAGASAVQIEDQVMPKRCGHFAGKEVIAADEMIQKIHAAVDSRRDPELLIVARTDARQSLGLAAALERAAAYREAGADILFVEAPRSVDELAAITAGVDAPHVANLVFGGDTPLVDRAALAELGFAIVLYANAALQSALHGMQTVLAALYRDGGLDAVSHLLASFAERQRIVGKPAFDALEQRYRARAPGD